MPRSTTVVGGGWTLLTGPDVELFTLQVRSEPAAARGGSASRSLPILPDRTPPGALWVARGTETQPPGLPDGLALDVAIGMSLVDLDPGGVGESLWGRCGVPGGCTVWCSWRAHP